MNIIGMSQISLSWAFDRRNGFDTYGGCMACGEGICA